MRYVGQRHNIKVPLPDTSDPSAIRTSFDRDYKRRYGHADDRGSAEFQALHLSAFSRLRRPELKWLPRAQGGRSMPQRRSVYFGRTGMLDTDIFDRTALPPGFSGRGPALIEEYGSTTLIWPGDRFEVGALSELRIHCGRD
jgi:N-methylhydantoinase A